MNQNNPRNKMVQNARNFRLMSRMDTFQQKRKTFDQLDYLQYYDEATRQQILNSMRGPIPDPLPPLSPTTISFYRRKSCPIFKTRHQGSNLDGHMTYQSLWILSSVDEKSFENYSQTVAKEFQRDLSLYLGANSTDIREMAVSAAGNKIIGKQSDILSMVEKDNRQLWVLANHILENRIVYTALLPFVSQQNEFAFRTLFDLSMLMGDCLDEITSSKQFVFGILHSFSASNENIRKYAMRIVGNIISSKEEFLAILLQLNFLNFLGANLNCSSSEVRKDCCWLITNICIKKTYTNAVIRHQEVMNKLVELFRIEAVLSVKKELTLIFCCIAHFADRKDALTLLGHPNVMEICYGQLTIQDNELNMSTLRLLHELLELGDNFKYEQGQNLIVEMMKRDSSLYSEISNKSYSENGQISGLSVEILNFLEEDDD